MNFGQLKQELRETNPNYSLVIFDLSNDKRFPVYYIGVFLNMGHGGVTLGKVRLGRFNSHLTNEEQESIVVNSAISDIKNIIHA